MKIDIIPGCIGCGMCETVCSEAFFMESGVAKVKASVDMKKHEEAMQEAADMCPVQVITITDE
jgi:ferredoxin